MMDLEAYEPPVVSDVSLEMATVGDVFFVGVDREVPADYHEIDGSVLNSRLYPEFVQAMDIAGPTFTLPAPARMREGIKSIIKMGRKIQPPEVPELAAARREYVERKREHVERERMERERDHGRTRRRGPSGNH